MVVSPVLHHIVLRFGEAQRDWPDFNRGSARGADWPRNGRYLSHFSRGGQQNAW